ncbi:MAG: alpha-amylase family glycosyl hydrolase, partial [Wenzhouxiangellaceae bacterium]
YSTVAFFAPKESYSTRAEPGCQLAEFKTMVRALHQAGIEVILDIVFNHTAEGDHTGPTLNYRGLDNEIYYYLEADRRFYRNYSGCGNTLNCSHPVVRDHVLDCLRYWVIDMHVDGFRFDLASVLSRDANGQLVNNPPLLERIAEDPVLRHVKLIAEAWDAAGAYQVGRFPGQRWSEWNGRYRDDVRRFWRGEPGMAGAFASRLCGSADIYEHGGKRPLHSINFITSHDGFTLNDLVSYENKHNDGNGEGNRDGSNENYSANYGEEGETSEADIERTRIRQIKNLLATLFLSRGVPMLLGGDEFRRTQRGNNNAYCQDNDVSWYDWQLLDANREIVDFVTDMIAFRQQHEVLRSERFYRAAELLWFDASGHEPSWDLSMTGLGCGISPEGGEPVLCLLFNPGDTERVYRLPGALAQMQWHLVIDTAKSPDDGRLSDATSATRHRWPLVSRSLQVLVNATV